jgi:AraC family transcriptional regulator of adaptative response / DNA-3-methyladenine glycosylase II
MRVIGDPDVLLTGDLVLRQGAAALGLPDDPAGLTARAAAWRPFRSYAGLHLWRAASRAGSRNASNGPEIPTESPVLAKGCV